MPKDDHHCDACTRRDARGRFLPGTKAPKLPGRPPGPNGVKARAAQLASDRLEAFLGKASSVIETALDEGDARVATWVFDRLHPLNRADFLKIDLLTDLKTPEAVVEAAREVMLAAGRGEISLSEARGYIDLLTRYGAMQGYVELETLKAKVEDVTAKQSRASGGMDLSRVPEKYRPVWGRGKENASNETPT